MIDMFVLMCSNKQNIIKNLQMKRKRYNHPERRQHSCRSSKAVEMQVASKKIIQFK